MLRKVIPLVISLCVVFAFWVKRIVLLKFYPPIFNGLIFCVFFFSLFSKETVIQRFVRLCGDKLEPPVFDYTRRVTYLWAVVTFINFLISSVTVFLSDRVWILYNGFISYLFVGIVFICEYSLRITLRKRGVI